MKHLLKLEDWSTEEITRTLNLADQLKYEQEHGIEHKLLQGKTLGMIFEKSSTRTRVSFEVGMTQLGGYPLFLSSNDLQIGRGEPVEDTARVLSRFVDAIMIRTFAQSEVEALAEYGSIPIINGLTDYCHPCQVLADLMTIRECKGKLEGLKMCFIGDGNNMLNSLAVGALRTGMRFSAACPDGYFPPEHIMGIRQAVRRQVPNRQRSDGGCQGRGRHLHRRVGVHGSGGRKEGARGCVCRYLSGQQGADGGHQRRMHGAALPACSPRRGDHRRGV